VFLAFVVFEGLVGVYFAVHGTLRSIHVEEATRASVGNFFRVPMNALVVLFLQLQLPTLRALALLTLAQIGALLSLMLFQSYSGPSVTQVVGDSS